MLGIALVAAEQLVTAVAAQHDLDVACRFARQIPGRHAGWIGERLVQIGDDP
jgi:hypothetical protein